MQDIVLKDIDEVLAERIRRAGNARGWSRQETLLHLLELGLFASESETRIGFDDSEVNVLSDAIAALRNVPGGHGI